MEIRRVEQERRTYDNSTMAESTGRFTHHICLVELAVVLLDGSVSRIMGGPVPARLFKETDENVASLDSST